MLIVGGGQVAARKLGGLLGTGARLTLVSPRLSPRVSGLLHQGSVQVLQRPFEDADVNDQLLVIAATNDAETNRRVALAAGRAGALLCRTDALADSDFHVPAVASGTHLRLTVSTGGQAPSAARMLARELRLWMEQGPDRFTTAIAEFRKALRSRSHETPDTRARKLRALTSKALLSACVQRDETAIGHLVDAANEDQTP